jgi:hydroxylamine dehydrogenase
MEARKPEACGQCHLGPDHPQIEIYMESKHGDIYTAHGDDYNWTAAPGTWTPGTDFRGPTCASCHMSGAGTCSPPMMSPNGYPGNFRPR